MTTATHEIIQVGGYVIFGFIMLPIYLMILGWVFGKPREFRTVAVTLGYVVGLLLAIVVGLAVLDWVLTLVRTV